MSGVVLPPPEPPRPDVQEVLALLRYASSQLSAARYKVGRAKQLASYSEPASMTTRVMLAVREYEASLWAAEIEALENQARALGVAP
jgi:hypothetical protein